LDAVLFDCWGTLVKAPELMRRGASAELFYRSLVADGYEVDWEAFRDAYVAESRRQHEETMRDLRELDYVGRLVATLQAVGIGYQDGIAFAERAWANYLAEWPRQSTLYDEAPALLSSIRGTRRLGLVTNFPDGPTARAVFRKLDFDSFFDSIVVSDEVGFRKPHRLVFERALRELGSEPESAVMIGDTFDADVKGAKDIGMRAILIDADGSQTENYVFADAVVGGLGEVREILKKL
jgi:putative hydrolase of the HAD superfamily